MEPRTGNLSIAVNLAHQFDSVFVLISEYNRLYLEALEYIVYQNYLRLEDLQQFKIHSTSTTQCIELDRQGLNASQKNAQRKRNKKLQAENIKRTYQFDVIYQG